MNCSERVSTYPRSGIRRMSMLAAGMDDVISLCIGEPDFDTPEFIVESAVKALREGCTHYCSNRGIDELREAIVEKYRVQMGLEYDVDNVIVTVGAAQALFHSFLSALNPGDEILIPDPYFPNYLGQLHLAGVKAVGVPLKEENQFRLQAADLEKAITPRTRAVIINSPSNPTGSFLEKGDLEEIAEVVRAHDLTVISDEVYESILYDGREYCSMAQLPGMADRVIIVNSLSKTYAMTGWRLGYVVAPKDYLDKSVHLQEAIVSCVPTFVQKAAAAALKGPQDCIQEMAKIYDRRRSIIIDGLNSIPGIKCCNTAGAFYAFPNIKAFGKSSSEFAEDLLKKAGVVVVPGSDFGSMGEGYIRLSFATSDDNLREAVRRIGAYVAENY